jgi:hypothetical protein
LNGSDLTLQQLAGLSTLIIAVATVVYVVFTILLWRATKRSADAAKCSADAAKASSEAAIATVTQMRNTAEQQLRAYVCVDSATLKFPQPNVPEAQVHFKNCGQTPAYHVRGWIHTWFGEYPLKEVLPTAPDDLRKGTETLAPGRRSIFVAPQKPPLPPQYLALLGSDKFTLYVYGEIRYRDIFGKERRTQYRLLHGGSESVRKIMAKDGSEQWLLKPDTEGNETS